ncbi:hypothetical protein E4U53_002661 [Claviceps sorghi]|nr:hypothetical protein E4U53_002661 [Claviceps sorghi]
MASSAVGAVRSGAIQVWCHEAPRIRNAGGNAEIPSDLKVPRHLETSMSLLQVHCTSAHRIPVHVLRGTYPVQALGAFSAYRDLSGSDWKPWATKAEGHQNRQAASFIKLKLKLITHCCPPERRRLKRVHRQIEQHSPMCL